MRVVKEVPDLTACRAVWAGPGVIAWPASALPPGLDPTGLEWRLHWSPTGGIDPRAPEPVDWPNVRLAVGDLPDALASRFPHLAGDVALRVPAGLDLAEIVRGQVVVVVQRPSGVLVNASGVQTAGLLDVLYAAAAKAELGPTWRDGVPTLRVWAPTARTVALRLVTDGDHPDGAEAGQAPEDLLPMTREPDGCWSIIGDASWRDGAYRYEVDVYAPSFDRVVRNSVTDPYAVALTPNSTMSVLVDLADPGLAPRPWLANAAPRLASPVDQTIYELHVRDFSLGDLTIEPALRGTYRAFTCEGLGTRHLRRLAGAGLNTVQLLPIFDYSTVDESRDRQEVVRLEQLFGLPPDSEEQQRRLRASAARDGFNWGYDPWHFMAPEGSLATPDGVAGGGRVREVREMIGALHGMGLRVVLDQVYNHTAGAGQGANSVLGRIVPGYYHRRTNDGYVATSTCCPNVATEHRMAAKLMVDSVVLWAKHYKVDGFRFDLMGHHSRANMVAVRAALDALTLEADGVDGRAVTLYGEGWDFGEVSGNARFEQAVQGQLHGTGIGTFSDRLRDAVRGGSPFDADPRHQGFGSGLWTAPNASTSQGNEYDQRDRLLYAADLVQLGLAGTLTDVSFVSQRTATAVRGDQLVYNGKPAGYAWEPDEAVNYVDAHDNETLFDALTMKLPASTAMRDRVRANTLCLALATLGQSAVLWHAGTDFLRSKSLDRNSYDSGDWFNRLDFSMTDNGFGSGLPMAADNKAHWPYMRPLLADPRQKPSADDMRHAHDLACDLLRLRASTRMFRLGSAAAIKQKLTFPVSGTWAQRPGTIVMAVDDTVGEPVDERWARLVVVFNATPWSLRQQVERLRPAVWQLHPVQAGGADPLVRRSRYDDGVFTVLGRTAAVFVEPRA
ncbi:pullulanase-type alpha-1,6-glucosidase [Nigerium massiliense]|uniref:pullulanase-type alpha-1,6-glucosidase n=1 Tax=Nigerium massiliense TaxID=1522317 RepID=UPI00069361E2|nr:pullulanase-type alpha-1,6-glucosidase [Nigerium massiliense]